jgi:hypothetical protein
VIFLTSTSDKLYVVTQGNATYDVQGAYIDWDGSRFTLGRVNFTIPGAATTDIITAPAAGVQRHIQRVTMRNTHASLRGNANFYHTDGVNGIVLWAVNFNAGSTVQYSDTRCWEQFSAPYGGITQIMYGAWGAYPPNPSGGTTDASNWRAYGINGQFTPMYSTRVYVTVSGHIENYVANAQPSYTLFYGTGTPPTFNTILPGGTTAMTPNLFFLGNTPGLWLPFTFASIIQGLTLGTTYWVDLFMLNYNGTGTQNTYQVSCLMMEV